MFSTNEAQVLKIIGRRKMTIIEITDKYYHSRGPRPMNANNYIGMVVRRINTKCEYHNLPWGLEGTGMGRGGKTVWRSKR